MMNRLYKKLNIVEYPKMTYKFRKAKDGELIFNDMLPPENALETKEKASFAGWHVGDLRCLKYNISK